MIKTSGSDGPWYQSRSLEEKQNQAVRRIDVEMDFRKEEEKKKQKKITMKNIHWILQWNKEF